jgi:antitoxin (DNA-binding transcriptional repressor) of toxin-antitoxin stability system
MNTTIGVYEAKTQLSRLIDRAAAGEQIVITRNGNAVAELRAVPTERLAPETIVAKFKAFRQRQSPEGSLRRPNETLRGLAHEGHDR